MRKTLIVIAASAMLPLAAVAQNRDSEQDRARADELREQIRDLTNELRELQGNTPRAWSYMVNDPNFGAVRFGAGRAVMGVEVNTRRNPATDSIGAVIARVENGSAAAKAGMAQGDIVTRFNGEPLTGHYPPASDFESDPAVKLIDLVKEYQPGDSIDVVYQRNGRTSTTKVVLDESESPFGLTLRSLGSGNFTFGGNLSGPRIESRQLDPLDVRISTPNVWMFSAFADLELVKMNEDLAEYFGTSEGVLVIETPEDNSMNLRGGDVILNIGGRVTDEPSRVFRILGTYDSGENVRLEVMRNGQRQTINGTVPERSGNVHFMQSDGR